MPPNAASSDELADWHMHSVLVVDDEPGMVNFLRRALAARCGVLDSAGDVASAAAILEIFRAFHQVGVTVIIATHDPQWMAHLSPRLLRLEHGCLATKEESAP